MSQCRVVEDACMKKERAKDGEAMNAKGTARIEKLWNGSMEYGSRKRSEGELRAMPVVFHSSFLLTYILG